MDRPVDLVYTAIMLSALGAGALARRFVREPAGKAADGAPLALSVPQRLALLFGVIVGGALGAKLPYVLADPEGAVSGLAWLRDGRTLTWGLAGGYLGVELAKRLASVRAKTGDGFAVPVAVSIAIGRLGCLHAGCCYGAPTGGAWGMDFGDGVLRHPNPLYEAAFHLAMAALLVWIGRRGWLATHRMKLYLVAYMAFRVVAEQWRPEPRVALGLTFYQLSALGFAALFTALFVAEGGLTRRGSARPGTAPCRSPR